MKNKITHSVSFATRTLILVAALFFRTITAHAQIINTIAGNGSYGYSGDNGPATSTGMTPIGVFVDASGNVYIADDDNNRVRKIAASTGIITTIAGNGTQTYSGDGGLATNAGLVQPVAVYVDMSGNVYIADAYGNRIRKVTAATGIITTIAGTGTLGYSGDGGLATSAELYEPTGICLDAFGNVYIAGGGNRIRKVTAATGIITTIVGTGTLGYSGDGGLATNAELSSATAVCVDDFGNLYISDSGNSRIRKVTASTGIISTIAGNGTNGFSGDGGLATNAELYNPQGIAVDSFQNVFFADFMNNRIRKIIVSTGIITTIAGDSLIGFAGDGGLATNAELYGPIGICIDDSGSLYIADVDNGRVRKVINCTISTYNELHSDTVHSSALMSNVFVAVNIDTVSNNIITTIDSMFISIHLDTTKIIKDSVVFITQCTSVDSNIYEDTISISTIVFDTIVHESSDTVACLVTIHNQVIADTTSSNALVLIDTVIMTHVDTVASKIITTKDSMFVSTYSHTERIIKDSIAFSVNQCTGVSDSIVYADTALAVYAVTRDTMMRESSDTSTCPITNSSQIIVYQTDTNVLASIDTSVVVSTDTLNGNITHVVTTTNTVLISTYVNTTATIRDSIVFSVNQCSGLITSIIYADTVESLKTNYDTVIHQLSDTTTLVNTGLENIDLPLTITAYPNPFHAELNVNAGENIATIILVDALGRMILQTKGAGHLIIQPNISSGIYFLRVTGNDISPTTIKVIAE